MCFSKENIINFNLTHITRDKNYENTKFYLSLLLKILFFIALLYVSISPWMQNMIFNINGILKKIIFSIISIIFLSLFLGKINDELTTEKKNNQTEITWWGVFIYFLFLLGPFLWTIGYLIWWGILIYWIIIFIILAIISNFLKKE